MGGSFSSETDYETQLADQKIDYETQLANQKLDHDTILSESAELAKQNFIAALSGGEETGKIKNSTEMDKDDLKSCVAECNQNETCNYVYYDTLSKNCIMGAELETEATEGTYSIIGMRRKNKSLEYAKGMFEIVKTAQEDFVGLLTGDELVGRIKSGIEVQKNDLYSCVSECTTDNNCNYLHYDVTSKQCITGTEIEVAESDGTYTIKPMRRTLQSLANAAEEQELSSAAETLAEAQELDDNSL